MILLLLSLLSTASADTLTCDAKSGPKLHYEEWSKSGGAMDEAETDELLREWTEEITHGLRSALKDDTLPTFTFKLKIPRGWTPPDRFSLVMKGAAGGLSATLTTVTRYTADVTVWTRSGATLPGLTVSKHTVKMRCEAVAEHGVP